MFWRTCLQVLVTTLVTITCLANRPFQQGDIQHRTVIVGNVDYLVLLVIPPKLESPAPVIICCHGGGGTAERALQWLGMQKLAEDKGVIIIAPNGQNHRWKAYGEPGAQVDFDMFGKLLDMVPELGGDPKRVYITGFSNGGFMAQHIGAMYADRIAAIGAGGSSVALHTQEGTIHENPKPKRPIPVLLFHGVMDDNVPYNQPDVCTPAPESLKWWVREDGLTGPAKHEELGNGQVLSDSYENEDGLRVQLLSFKNLDHNWPTNVDAQTGLHFNDILWKFFSQYSL